MADQKRCSSSPTTASIGRCRTAGSRAIPAGIGSYPRWRNVTQYYAVPCPHCQHELRVRAEYAGKRITCRHCTQSFVAPEAPAAESPATELERGPAEFAALQTSYT